jgi:multiple antibiotic resistance protein
MSPLVLFAASPGTITGVITLSVAHAKTELPVTALVAVVVALTVTWLVMIAAARSAGQKKRGLLHTVTTRFMGLIVLAMGVQFSLTGLEAFFTA